MNAAKKKTKEAKAPKKNLMELVNKAQLRSDMPDFQPGDTVKVHCKIVEGNKERIQVFQGLVIKRSRSKGANATFTVRKVSYNIGVERTFLLHSPRIAKLEILSRGRVRRAKLFYLRELRGKAARIQSLFYDSSQDNQNGNNPVETQDEPITSSADSGSETTVAVENSVSA